MGVSFHSVIEFKEHKNYFDFAEVDIPRGDKLLPAIVFGNGGLTDEMLFEPRGMPPDFTWKVRELFFTGVKEVKQYLEDERSIADYVETAGEWAVEQYKTNGILPAPELHSSGWLTFGELRKVLIHEELNSEDFSPKCRAALAAMQSLSQDFGEDNVRLVFWCGM